MLKSQKNIVISICKNVLYRNCIYNRFPEDEPSGSKHVEDIKILIKMLFCILYFEKKVLK